MTTHIHFFPLSSENTTQIFYTICNLLHIHYSNKHNIYILCPDQDYLYQIDEFIVTYQETNFFPYQLLGEGPIPPAPICLGTEHIHKLKYDILLNLSDEIPENFKKYKKIIEFVPALAEQRGIVREHYKHYAKYNCPITTEELQEVTL